MLCSDCVQWYWHVRKSWYEPPAVHSNSQRADKFSFFWGERSRMCRLYFAQVHSKPSFIDDMLQKQNDSIGKLTLWYFQFTTSCAKSPLSRIETVSDNPVTFLKCSPHRPVRLPWIEYGPSMRLSSSEILRARSSAKTAWLWHVSSFVYNRMASTAWTILLKEF